MNGSGGRGGQCRVCIVVGEETCRPRRQRGARVCHVALGIVVGAASWKAKRLMSARGHQPRRRGGRGGATSASRRIRRARTPRRTKLPRRFAPKATRGPFRLAPKVKRYHSPSHDQSVPLGVIRTAPSRESLPAAPYHFIR